MICFLTEVIGIRDDMFLGEGHTYMQEVGAALDRRGSSRACCTAAPSVVNLQCDIDHPTQALADLCWLQEALRRPGQRSRARRSP